MKVEITYKARNPETGKYYGTDYYGRLTQGPVGKRYKAQKWAESLAWGAEFEGLPVEVVRITQIVTEEVVVYANTSG